MNPAQCVRLSLSVWITTTFLLISNSASLAGTVIARAHVHDSVGQSTGTDSDSDLTFAVADTGDLDVSGAHSRAWASAVVAGSVFKSTGGEGWVTNGNDAKHHYWRARADTGVFEVLGMPGDIVELRARIRATGDQVALDQAAIAQPSDAPPEVGIQYPSQGFFSERDFEVFFSLDITVDTEDGTTQLFLGDATLRGPLSANSGLVATGDLANVFTVDEITSPNNQRRLVAITPLDIVSPVFATTPTNTSFQLNFDQLLTDNQLDEDEPPLIFATPHTFVTSGQMVVELFAVDQNGNPLQIRAIVPEPSAILLAFTGFAAMLIGRRRFRA